MSSFQLNPSKQFQSLLLEVLAQLSGSSNSYIEEAVLLRTMQNKFIPHGDRVVNMETLRLACAGLLKAGKLELFLQNGAQYLAHGGNKTQFDGGNVPYGLNFASAAPAFNLAPFNNLASCAPCGKCGTSPCCCNGACGGGCCGCGRYYRVKIG